MKILIGLDRIQALIGFDPDWKIKIQILFGLDWIALGPNPNRTLNFHP